MYTYKEGHYQHNSNVQMECTPRQRHIFRWSLKSKCPRCHTGMVAHDCAQALPSHLWVLPQNRGPGGITVPSLDFYEDPNLHWSQKEARGSQKEEATSTRPSRTSLVVFPEGGGFMCLTLELWRLGVGRRLGVQYWVGYIGICGSFGSIFLHCNFTLQSPCLGRTWAIRSGRCMMSLHHVRSLPQVLGQFVTPLLLGMSVSQSVSQQVLI